LITLARRVAMFGALALALGACVPICGIGAKFALTSAHVDAQYNCPNGSNRSPYDVHGTIEASNTLSNTVTIKSIDEVDQIVATAGAWEGSKNAKDGGPITGYSPRSVGPGDDATIKFAVGFICTSSGPSVTTYADFAFTFTVKTSAGTYTIKSGNNHRLNFPTT
jgi:hypothetical protein